MTSKAERAAELHEKLTTTRRGRLLRRLMPKRHAEFLAYLDRERQR